MIRAVLHDFAGHQTVLLGLGPENMRRLHAGEPVKVNLQRLDPAGPVDPTLPDIDIVIAFDDGGLAAVFSADMGQVPEGRGPTQRRGWPGNHG